MKKCPDYLDSYSWIVPFLLLLVSFLSFFTLFFTFAYVKGWISQSTFLKVFGSGQNLISYPIATVVVSLLYFVGSLYVFTTLVKRDCISPLQVLTALILLLIVMSVFCLFSLLHLIK